MLSPLLPATRDVGTPHPPSQQLPMPCIKKEGDRSVPKTVPMGRNYDGQGSDKGDATQVIRPRPFLAGTGAAAGEVLLAGSRAPPHVTAAAIRHCGPNAARPLRTRVLRKDQLTFAGWLPSMPDHDPIFPSKTDSSTYQPKFKIFCFAGEDSFFSPRSHPQCNRHPDSGSMSRPHANRLLWTERTW